MFPWMSQRDCSWDRVRAKWVNWTVGANQRNKIGQKVVKRESI